MIKDNIITLLEVMSENEAKEVLDFIKSNFVLVPKQTWDDVEETEPDETDKAMIEEIKTNPECNEFYSESEAMKAIELRE